MRFDWKPESKERYFRKAEAAVKAAGFDGMKCLRQKTSSARNTRAFSYMLL